MADRMRCVAVWDALVTGVVCLALAGCRGQAPVTLASPSAAPAPTATSGLVAAIPTATLSTEPRPSATTAASATAIPVVPVAQPSPTGTQTRAPQPSPSPTAPSPYQLVFARMGSVLRGDLAGEGAREVASLPALEEVAFRDGLLASVQGAQVLVVDLNAGAQRTISLPVKGELIHAEPLWGREARALLVAAIVAANASDEAERHVELLAFAADDGRALGAARLDDVIGVTLLDYDETQHLATLIPLNEDEALKVWRVDLATGQRTQTITTRGRGEGILSSDGRYLLTQTLDETTQALALLRTDLEQGSAPQVIWPEAPGTHSVSHVWSPDGRRVAYLEQDGVQYWEATRGLGLWVLDVDDHSRGQVLDMPELGSYLVGWTPDGAYILGYRRQGESGFFYIVRPDGGEFRPLSLDPQAQVLGWMAPPAGDAPVVAIDPWPGRVASALGDGDALAQVVAEWLVAQGDRPADTLELALHGLLGAAGWELGVSPPRLLRVGDQDLTLAQLPPGAIYVLEGDRAMHLASGDLILDARLEGDDLGLIYGSVGASAVQPALALYRRAEDGAWQRTWAPQGLRDWIATDGEIRFLGEGLQNVRVRGSSFGLPNGVFNECHACPHRQLEGTWVRKGDGYVRQTALHAEAINAQVYWEMTARTPYAVLDEFLRRLRAGQAVEELISGPDVVLQVRVAGLLDATAPLVAEQETEKEVRFGGIDGPPRYVAEVRQGRVVRIERLTP